MRVYIIIEYLLLTVYSNYAQEKVITGGLTVTSENQIKVPVEKRYNYKEDVKEVSEVVTNILTDEHNVHKVTDDGAHNFNKNEITAMVKNITQINATEIAKAKQTKTVDISNQLSNNILYSIKINDDTSRPRKIRNESTCHKEIVDICRRIGEFQQVPCDDGTIIPLFRLCDNTPDCLEMTDELDCKEIIEDKIKAAYEILLDANDMSECMPQTLEGGKFSDVFKYWQKALHSNWVCYDTNWYEITTTISTIFHSFESHICTPIEHIDIVTNEFLKLEEDLDNLIAGDGIKDWSPVSCICYQQYCKSDNCDSRCKRICWQVYTLNNWICQSVIGETSISLDFICDGKIDCIDESDENSCMKESFSYKHNAEIIYDELIKIIIPESKSKKYKLIKIEKLIDITKNLRILTVKTRKPDINTVKSTRNEYFKLLVEIFKDVWSSSTLREINYAYDFLLSLNKRMVKALKRSYTGNKYILSHDKCNCNDNICAALVCSRKCNIFCSIEPVLTRYVCDGSNISLSIEAVCDGTKQCPNGEDEKDCKHYVCRTRHLDQLRNNIQKAEKLLRDYVVTKVLDWNDKIAQILEINGNIDLNRVILADKVTLVLHELAVMFASMTETSNSSELDIKGFIEASDVIKQTLRTCGARTDGN